MILDDAINRPTIAEWTAERIAELRSLSPLDAITEKLRRLALGPVASVFVPGDSQGPAFFLGVSGAYGIFLSDGISNFDQGAGTWNGYVGGIPPTVANPDNAYFVQCAARCTPYFTSSMTVGVSKWLFAGWSLGGCVAQLTMAQLLYAGVISSARWMTFGSPRIGNNRLASFVSASQGTRWMNTGDSVPYLPPRIGDMPALPALYGILPTIRMQNFVHTSHGCEILDDGTLRAADLPVLSVPSFPASIASWLLGVDNTAGSPHNIASYVARLKEASKILPLPSQDAPRTGGVEPAGSAVRREASQAEQAFQQALAEAATQQSAQRQSVIAEWQLQAVNVGGVWTLVLNGEAVAWVGPKKRARAIAQFGNQFLRRLLLSGYVDRDQLLGKLQAFLGAAGDPTSGITPTMRVVLPM